jgi:hypothetical protein
MKPSRLYNSNSKNKLRNLCKREKLLHKMLKTLMNFYMRICRRMYYNSGKIISAKHQESSKRLNK